MLLYAVSISMKKKTNQWFKKHRIAALSGVTSVTTGLIIMILFKESQGYPHLASTHAIGGLVTGFIALITLVLGYLIINGNKNVKPYHKWSGRLTLILVAITIIFGVIRLLEIVNK